MRGYSLIVRSRARVERSRFADLEAALVALELRGDELQAGAHAPTVDLKLGRAFDPVQQVFARIELAGRGQPRLGVDVRGDGSAEAWTGRVRRRLVEQRPGETPYGALRRTLGR